KPVPLLGDDKPLDVIAAGDYRRVSRVRWPAATPVSIAHVLEPGAVVGDYEIISPIDGASYLASREGRTVVLVAGADVSFRRAGGGLDHPAIAAVYDVFEYRGAPYLAREHVPGGTVRGWIGRATPAQAAGVLEATLAALA